MKKYLIRSKTSIKACLKKMSKAGEKCLIVTDQDSTLIGTLSDGDLRRAIMKEEDINIPIEDYLNSNPTYLQKGAYSIERVKDIFLTHKFDLIPIVDEDSKLVDVLVWADIFDGNKENINRIDVPVVIMAGGKGTRLQPFTEILPKPLMPVNNKTIIEHIIDNFKEKGVDKFFLTINYKSKILKAFFQELEPSYSLSFIEESKPLGTAGSLKLLPKELKEPFFVTNCDILIKADYLDLYKFHKKNKFDITLVASAKEYLIPYGTCKLNNQGHLSSIEEKPVFDFLVNTGLYVINPEILKLIPEDKLFDMPDLIAAVKKNNKKTGVYPIGDDAWTDIGQWAEYKKALVKFT